ncbi:MAG: hypothetical protein EOM13_06465 [Clostridia bacterium]|nr:hypothetical protein [Clostridia bacterium]
MALKDGRCPNCGSLLALDPNAEKGHCLFCDAVFENKRAFEIAGDPAGYEFPNEPQPKYEGPSLNPKNSGNAAVATQPAAPKKKKATAKPVYIHKEPIKLPDIKLSPKVRKKVILFVLAAVILIAGISTPLIMTRNSMRASLKEAMPQIAPFAVDVEQATEIRRLTNTYLLIVAPGDISEEDLILLFRQYAEKRAEIRGLDLNDFDRVYRPVTVKVVTENGSYLMSEPEAMATLSSDQFIQTRP